MRVGAVRTDVDYEWPSTLELPERPPKLVYLDLNHWIALSKVIAGHADGVRYIDAFEFCLSLVSDGKAVFPISSATYIEVSKIRQHRQRRFLREAIEILSHYFVVTARSVVSIHEIEAVLDRLIGPSRRPINRMAYLDRGVARAFGKVGGFRVRGPGGADVTDEIRAGSSDGPQAFDAVLQAAELRLNRKALEGPTPEEEPRLRSVGWNPSAVSEAADRRAAQEIEQTKRFDEYPSWRRGRIRDVVAAREMFLEINEFLYKGISDRGVQLGEVFPDPEDARRAFDAMPSFDVAVTLKTSYHRDPNHHWTVNDMHDIDALGSTIPYCDIVVTDKAAASHVNGSGLADRLGTTVITRLDDLASAITA